MTITKENREGAVAVVDAVKKVEGTVKVQPTHVVAEIKIGEFENHEPIVQIDTRGSENREIEGKQSQTLQLTRSSAHELFVLLREVYHF